MVTKELSVQGMHCASCGMNVDETLADLDGVISASTDVKSERTTVEFDPDAIELTTITEAISQLGYEVQPV